MKIINEHCVSDARFIIACIKHIIKRQLYLQGELLCPKSQLMH